MPRKLTYNDVKIFVESRGYTLLSEIFYSSSDKITVKCPKGHEYSIKWSKFKSGSECNYCKGHYISYDTVKEKIESVGYTLISKNYINAHTHLNVMCDKKHPYKVTWNDFNSGKRCPKCIGRNTTYSEVVQKGEECNYIILTKEESFMSHKRKKISIRCNNGHEYEQALGDFMKGYKCRKCQPNMKLTHEEVCSSFKSYGYTLVSEYENSWTKMDVICPNGHSYKVSWDNFKYGCRCPICIQSNGEKAIDLFLTSHDIDFISEFIFKGCSNKESGKKLRFDFYLPKYNLCIEYDGKQHFEPIEFFGGQEAFEKTQYRDGIKNDYCKKNNIGLLRIPYLDFDNIENILKEKLNI